MPLNEEMVMAFFRHMTLSTVLGCVCVLAFPGAAATQDSGGPLTDADFLVAGLQMNDDSADVRRTLGAPDSVVVSDHPFDASAQLAAWFYPSLIVSYGYSGSVTGVMLTTPEHATARGLRVADSAARVRELYGEPQRVYENSRTYADPKDMEGLHVIQISVVDGRVDRIFVGYLLD